MTRRSLWHAVDSLSAAITIAICLAIVYGALWCVVGR